MAQTSKLTNTGSTTFKQVIDGEVITIEPGESKTYPRRKAIAIRGHYCGRGVPVSLKLEHLGGSDTDEVKFICQLDGIEFESREALDKHLETHRGDTVGLEPEKVFVAPDGKEFKSKAGLVSYLRSLERKEKKDDTVADTVNS